MSAPTFAPAANPAGQRIDDRRRLAADLRLTD
jgi:hypothetical protein